MLPLANHKQLAITCLCLCLIIVYLTPSAMADQCQWTSSPSFWRMVVPDEITHCIATGHQVNARDPVLKYQPLHYAAMVGNISAAKTLIDAGADIEGKGRYGYTPLMTAVRHHQAQMVQVLINTGATIAIQDERGYQPLHWLAHCDPDPANRHRQLMILQYLLAAGADVFAKTPVGQSPLTIAMRQRDCDTAMLAELLKQYGSRWTLLHEWARDSKQRAIKALIAAGTITVNAKDTADRDLRLLHYVGRDGHTEVVKALIAGGADVNARNIHGHTPLYWAVLGAVYGGKSADAVKALIAGGADVNARDKGGNTSLHQGVSGDEPAPEVVKALIAAGTDVNAVTDGLTPLHFAAANGIAETISILFSAGADFTIRDKKGRITLHYGPSCSPDIMTSKLKRLITHSKDLNAKDDDGQTPLHFAALWGCADEVATLIDHGADIHIKDNEGQTPLHTLAQARYATIQAIDTLIKAGGDLKTKDKHGKTPLHLAAIHATKDIIDALIDHGGNVTMSDNSGKTVQDYLDARRDIKRNLGHYPKKIYR